MADNSEFYFYPLDDFGEPDSYIPKNKDDQAGFDFVISFMNADSCSEQHQINSLFSLLDSLPVNVKPVIGANLLTITKSFLANYSGNHPQDIIKMTPELKKELEALAEESLAVGDK